MRCMEARIWLQAKAADHEDGKCNMALCGNDIRYGSKSWVCITIVGWYEIDEANDRCCNQALCMIRPANNTVDVDENYLRQP